LADLGVRKLKVLGTQKKFIALSGFDLEIAEYIN
jgi:3,4-dihydroxy 2-butanone 4-phosphate synthase/GTP cyclohydrolase II